MIKSFRDLKPGQMFHALKSEIIGAVKGQGGRKVDNTGLHVKIGNSHAVKIEQVKNGKVTETKDAIFPLSMPCREVQNNRIDVSNLADWAIVNQGKGDHS